MSEKNSQNTHLVVAYDFVGQEFQAGLGGTNLLCRSSVRIAQWHSTGHWARLEGPRWLHMCLLRRIMMVYVH